jgi:hypothetical protein
MMMNNTIVTISLVYDKPLDAEKEKELKSKLEMFLRMSGKDQLPPSSYEITSKTIARALPKVYWCQRPKGEKDLLIFDAGHMHGDMHVYEHKETLPATELNRLMTNYPSYQAWNISQE